MVIRKEFIFLIILVAIASFFCLYKLTESPPIWYDEGFIIQSSENLSKNGTLGFQVAPGQIIRDAGIFTTGYPLAYPVALSLKIFGRNLASARGVMVFFLAASVILFYFFAKKMFGFRAAAFGSLLLVSFAPLYGNGKNVLGEVPGFFFFVAFLFFIHKIEKDDFRGDFYYLLAGLAAGLCVSTKMFFLALLPAIILGVLIARKKILFRPKLIFLAVLSFFIPIIILFATQFSQPGSFSSVASVLSNPNGLGFSWVLVFKNLSGFFKDATPLYFLGMFAIWIASILIRLKLKNKPIFLTEWIAFIFVCLIFIGYLKTAGWYRYLFVGQAIALLFLVPNLENISDFLRVKLKQINFQKAVFCFFLPLLIGFQLYQLLFNSWVAGYYGSKKTAELEAYFSRYSAHNKILIYNVPEIVIFLPSENYYQYLKINPAIIRGEEELAKIYQGIFDEIIMSEKDENLIDAFKSYKEKQRISKYVILERKN